jgi:hypothetical protein
MGTLHEDVGTLLSISRWILLRMRNVSDSIVDKVKTRLLYSVDLSGNRAVCEIMWKNIVEPDRPQIWYNTTHALFILGDWGKNIDTCPEYLTLIASARQPWLRERTSLLCYTYIACLVDFCFGARAIYMVLVRGAWHLCVISMELAICMTVSSVQVVAQSLYRLRYSCLQVRLR